MRQTMSLRQVCDEIRHATSSPVFLADDACSTYSAVIAQDRKRASAGRRRFSDDLYDELATAVDTVANGDVVEAAWAHTVCAMRKRMASS